MGPTSGPQFFLIECRLQELQGFLHIDRTRYKAPPTGRQAKKPTPPGFKQLDEALTRKLDALELSLLDVLADTMQWTAWGEHFAPLSGHQGKIREEGRRKILTTFAYGTGLGPTQTAKNIADISARQIEVVPAALETARSCSSPASPHSTGSRHGGRG